MLNRLIAKIIDILHPKPINAKVHLDIATLKAAWAVLNEVEIAGLFTGEAIETSIKEVCESLFTQGKLIEIVNIVTHKDFAEDRLSFLDAIGIMTRFFYYIAEGVKPLRLLIGSNQALTQTQ